MELFKRTISKIRHVEFVGLNDYAGYAVAALFDPFVTRSARKQVKIYLDISDAVAEINKLEGISVKGPYAPQKERIEFHSARVDKQILYMPLQHFRMETSSKWKQLASCAELPSVVVNNATVVFSFNPLQLIKKYLNMMEPDITADITDLLVSAILTARDVSFQPDNNSLRRDFHSLGISVMMMDELCELMGVKLSIESMFNVLDDAAKAYVEQDFQTAQQKLSKCFQILEAKRCEIAPIPVYCIDMLHGGILFEQEGFAEYDWPEASAKVLRLYLDWAETFGYGFAPDIGAGTLKNLASTHPDTINKLKKAWEENKIEFVNGTYSQPYLQLWDIWSQEKQFEIGLRTFEQLFGRRPTVYAAQEIALHPGLPKILNKFGYKYTIHRSQNLGTTPVDKHVLIDWQGNDGSIITALPAHSSRSEKAADSTYESLPKLIWKTMKEGLSLAAFTNLIDQTFIGTYKEEVVRTSRYCKVWGEFVTPTQFFERTSDLLREKVFYPLDVYEYDIVLPPGNYHRYEMGGESTRLEYLYQQSQRLQIDESNGVMKSEDLLLLLNAQAHDTYLCSYFKTGAFLERYLTDYCGPRYIVETDAPRGVKRYAKDVVKIPDVVRGIPPVQFDAVRIKDNTIMLNNIKVSIDAKTGCISGINGFSVSLGKICFNGKQLEQVEISSDKNRLLVTGQLEEFGNIQLIYGLSSGNIFCEVQAEIDGWQPDCNTPYWNDCVYLAHEKPAGSVVIRHCSEIAEETNLPDFFSTEFVDIKDKGIHLKLLHGGNIFFLQFDNILQNRLWSYGDTAKSFWWGVKILLNKSEN